jgi:hypothetical protein
MKNISARSAGENNACYTLAISNEVREGGNPLSKICPGALMCLAIMKINRAMPWIVKYGM